MHNKITPSEIVTIWKNYDLFNSFDKTKISASTVHEHQQLYINDSNVSDFANGVSITIPKKTLIHIRNSFSTKTSKDKVTEIEQLSILFPIIRCTEYEKGKRIAKYMPLFSYPIPSKNIIEYINASEISDLTLSIPINDGQLVSPLPYSFQYALNYNIQELGENRHFMSVVEAILGEKFNNFHDAFTKFNFWIRENIKDKKSFTIESGFNTLISKIFSDDFITRRDAEEFTYISEQNIERNFPLLNKYLTHESNNTLEVNNIPIYGLFESKYALSYGQLKAIFSINDNENLVAVQGAPGTGKTTLFKSLIAQQIVNRAIDIINNNEHNTGMLVTSTAIKAVGNIIDDLKADDLTKDLPWLWFQGGSKDQVKKEIERISKLFESWDMEIYSKEQQNIYKDKIIDNKNKIDNIYNDYTSKSSSITKLLHQVSIEINSLEKLNEFINELKEKAKISLNKIDNVKIEIDFANFDEINNKLESRLLDLVCEKEEYINADRIITEVLAIWPVDFSKENIVHWFKSEIRYPFEENFHDLSTSWIKLKIASLFSKKTKKLKGKLNGIYSEEFNLFKIGSYSDVELSVLANKSRAVSEKNDIFKCIDIVECYQNKQPLIDEVKSAINDIKTLIEMIGKQKNILDLHHEFKDEYPEDSWIDIFRVRLIKQNRDLFDASIKFIWQEQLRRKNEIKEVIELWKKQISGEMDSVGFNKWKDRLDEYYTALSLVYPVMASPLVSIYKLAGYQKFKDLGEHKPWNLALCDEAGMVSVNNLLPLLCRSNKAMIVGDPLQIEPVRTISEGSKALLQEKHFTDRNTLYEKLSPITVTAYHRAAGALTGAINDIGNGIVLDSHRRCQPDIANLFIKLANYDGISINTAKPSDSLMKAFQNMGSHHLMFYSVEGKRHSASNTNIDEAETINLLLDKLEEAGYDLANDVGIITPYANQKILLIQRVGARLNHSDNTLRIGSVHQFQGVGFDVIIYSPVIHMPSDSTDFQNSKPNLLNVAVSRAKQQFIIVGNYNRLMNAGGYMRELANTVANDFLIEIGSQHPQFEEVKNSPSLVRYYRDCEHIFAFQSFLTRAKKEIIIVSPWIRHGYKSNRISEQFELIKKAKNNGLEIKIYYGYSNNKNSKEDSDQELVDMYVALLGESNVIRIPEGTHEKLIIIDQETVVLGSWNWLSHGYQYICSNDENKNLIRHELSAEIRDINFIKKQHITKISIQ